MNEQPKKNILDHLLSIDSAIGGVISRTAVKALNTNQFDRDTLLCVVEELCEVRREIWSIEELRILLKGEGE